jgi:hypothetical protein
VEYLTCNQIFPTKELAAEAISRTHRVRAATGPAWSNWDEPMPEIKNSAVVQFYNAELSGKRESNLAYRALY